MSAANTSRNDRKKFWWLSIGVALALNLGLVIATLFWLPELPDPIALHWSSNVPDNFGNVWLIVLLSVAVTLGFAIFCYFAGRSVKNSNRLGAGAKLLGSINIWLSVLLTLGIGYSIYIQRGVLDATTVENGDQV